MAENPAHSRQYIDFCRDSGAGCDRRMAVFMIMWPMNGHIPFGMDGEGIR